MMLLLQWLASPACTELEQVVMDWGAKLFGLGDQFLCKSKVGGGVIQVSLSFRLSPASLCLTNNPIRLQRLKVP